MDFFAQQDRARRQTKMLVLLFVLAVLAIVCAVNLALALVWIWSSGQPLAGAHRYPAGFFATNTLITLALIGGGTLIQSWNLRDGGDAVARMAGGRPLQPASRDLAERRLLNVVEEMALASGIACPRVYLLDREEGINAFAAGHNQHQAVLAVTRGALKRLNRDELQGVIGHEFSHILNGDMRLNVNLIGVLFGIQMVAAFGRTLMEFGGRVWGRRGRDQKGGAGQAIVLAIGATLFVVGYIGIFFGRLIKAAVSRQREFLADASAVQFTRNPDGIGGALRKIGGFGRNHGPGSCIDSPNAEQLSHLFLGAARPNLMSGWLATHPPLAERLRRIYGHGIEPLEAPEIIEPAPAAAEPMLADIPYFAPASAPTGTNTSTSAASAGSMTAPAAGRGECAPPSLPLELAHAAREPQAACALVYALLLGTLAERPPQMALLAAAQPQQARLAARLAQLLERLPRSARLPLLDLATPALRQLSDRQRQILLETAAQLIAADARITLAEFVVQTVLQRRLDPHAGRAVPVRFSSLGRLRAEVALLLSLVAHVAARAPEAMAPQAQQRFLRAAASCPELRLTAQDFQPASLIGFGPVRAALERATRLAPLAKPGLVKAWLAAAGADAGDGAADANAALSLAAADILHALCAAIDAPLPPVVAASRCGWHATAG